MSWPKALGTWLALGVAAVAAGSGVARAKVGVGDRFPSIAGGWPGSEGAVPALAGKVVLVDFWASWCPPCKASFPAYARLQADYGGRGLVVLAVGVDESRAAYVRFLRRMNPAFAVVRDGAQQLVQAVAVPAMPTCLLVGRDGRVRFMGVGFHGAASEASLRRAVEAALKEGAVAP